MRKRGRERWIGSGRGTGDVEGVFKMEVPRGNLLCVVLLPYVCKVYIYICIYVYTTTIGK